MEPVLSFYYYKTMYLVFILIKHYVFPLSLSQDLQEAQGFSEEGAPERLACINKWTCKLDANYGANCAQETEGRLTHFSLYALANAARRYMYFLI